MLSGKISDFFESKSPAAVDWASPLSSKMMRVPASIVMDMRPASNNMFPDFKSSAKAGSSSMAGRRFQCACMRTVSLMPLYKTWTCSHSRSRLGQANKLDFANLRLKVPDVMMWSQRGLHDSTTEATELMNVMYFKTNDRHKKSEATRARLNQSLDECVVGTTHMHGLEKTSARRGFVF